MRTGRARCAVSGSSFAVGPVLGAQGGPQGAAYHESFWQWEQGQGFVVVGLVAVGLSTTVAVARTTRGGVTGACWSRARASVLVHSRAQSTRAGVVSGDGAGGRGMHGGRLVTSCHARRRRSQPRTTLWRTVNGGL